MRRLRRILAATASREHIVWARGYQRLRRAKATDPVEQFGLALQDLPIFQEGDRLSPPIRQGLDTPDKKTAALTPRAAPTAGSWCFPRSYANWAAKSGPHFLRQFPKFGRRPCVGMECQWTALLVG
jgi:hypothetical protein